MTLDDTLQKLSKWRNVFAGWQLGTRPKGDAESDAVRDHRELTILLRAEVNALTQILLRKRVFSQKEFEEQLHIEATLLDERYEALFPGFSTDLQGVVLDIEPALETMRKRNWRP